MLLAPPFLRPARGPTLPPRVVLPGVPALGVPGPREDWRARFEEVVGREVRAAEPKRRFLKSEGPVEESRGGRTWIEVVGVEVPGVVAAEVPARW